MELEEMFAEQAAQPELKRAVALAEADHQLLRSLVQLRRAARLTQQAVAEKLGIAQATVAAFERYDNDPRLSTVRRYAQAVGALVAHAVEADVGQLDAPGGTTEGGAWVPSTMGTRGQLMAHTSKPVNSDADWLATQLNLDRQDLRALPEPELDKVLSVAEGYFLAALSARAESAGELPRKSSRRGLGPGGTTGKNAVRSAEDSVRALLRDKDEDAASPGFLKSEEDVVKELHRRVKELI